MNRIVYVFDFISFLKKRISVRSAMSLSLIQPEKLVQSLVMHQSPCETSLPRLKLQQRTESIEGLDDLNTK